MLQVEVQVQSNGYKDTAAFYCHRIQGMATINLTSAKHKKLSKDCVAADTILPNTGYENHKPYFRQAQKLSKHKVLFKSIKKQTLR